MLRVIVELDDVGMTVGSFHQVGLRSSAHLADEAASGNRHLRAWWEEGQLGYLKDYMPDEKETPRPGLDARKKSRWS